MMLCSLGGHAIPARIKFIRTLNSDAKRVFKSDRKEPLAKTQAEPSHDHYGRCNQDHWHAGEK
jgi:hypothetical protein